MTPEKWWKTINDDNLTKCGRSWEEENILTLEVILKWHSIESQRAEEYKWMAMTLWNDFNPNQRYLNSPIVRVIGQNDNHTSLLRSISEVTKMTWNQAPRIENAFQSQLILCNVGRMTTMMLRSISILELRPVENVALASNVKKNNKFLAHKLWVITWLPASLAFGASEWVLRTWFQGFQYFVQNLWKSN